MAQKSLKERKPNEEIEELLEQLAKLLDRTKIMYEQYFMGIQKVPPTQLHRDIERRIRELTREQIRNTGLRYRLTNLKQKFGSYNSYWRRILREIERGTYIRDVARVGRNAARRGQDIAPEVLAAMPKRMRERILRDRDMARAKADRDRKKVTLKERRAAKAKGRTAGNVHRIQDNADDLDLDALFDSITSEGPGTLKDPGSPKPPAAKTAATTAAKSPPPKPRASPRPPPIPGKPSARPPARRPAAGSAPPPGMSSGQAKQLYDQYVKAKRLVGERTDNLTYDKLMRSLNKQAPGIMSKHKARGVEFGVVIKNEKVVLKAKPKK
ncbi:MAG: hypothetical protein KJO07_06110 [Deltaproteobacteria bacterium]|nr:hypothetical protein [Deltaproteobacteria bacterium]